MNTKPEETQTHHHKQSDTSSAPPTAATTDPASAPTEKWGTHIMGPPAAPSAHPNNQKAAQWSAEEHHQPQHPYVQYSPIENNKQTTNNPMEPVIHTFNTWTHKAESLARNIWQNLKTGPSLSDAVYGKVGLTTKVLTGGGFESLYKQTFGADPNEKLKRTFACYLSTATGPVAGTLYLTNLNTAFCSDRPLSFAAPSGQVAWSYYKVMLPLGKISSINPITVKENPAEKYIQIATVDNHDFWFMGFVNYDKATNHLNQSFSEFNSTGAADHHHGHGPPPPPVGGGYSGGSEYDNAGLGSAPAHGVGYPAPAHGGSGSGSGSAPAHGVGYPAPARGGSGSGSAPDHGVGYPAPAPARGGSGSGSAPAHGVGYPAPAPAPAHGGSGSGSVPAHGVGYPAPADGGSDSGSAPAHGVGYPAPAHDVGYPGGPQYDNEHSAPAHGVAYPAPAHGAPPPAHE